MTLAEQLIGKGFELRIYDRNVQAGEPRWAPTATTSSITFRTSAGCWWIEPAQLFDAAEVVVIATAEKEFARLLARHGAGKIVIDLVGTGELEAARQCARHSRAMTASPGRRVLIIVENLPCPSTGACGRRRSRCNANGYQVCIICPKGRGYNAALRVPRGRAHLPPSAAGRGRFGARLRARVRLSLLLEFVARAARSP